MNTPQTVFVVDDDEAMRNSLQRLLEAAGLRVRTFPDAVSFLTAYNPANSGCLVLDVRMPGLSGLELQERLRSQNISIPVIMITAHGDVPKAVQALKAGAIDFVEKPFKGQVILSRIQKALEIDREQRDRDARTADIQAHYRRLTPREREVMALVVQGRLNKQIAADLGLSHKTVEIHRAHVMQKMEVESLAELVRLAMLLEADLPHPAADEQSPDQ